MELLKNWFGKRGVEYHEIQYDIKNIGNMIAPEKLSHANSFVLANSVSELFFPVDFCADRVSKVIFKIAKASGKIVENTELNRFVSDGMNPLFSHADLVYNYVFSLLADGNAINYIKAPETLGGATANNITRWDVLQPNLVEIKEAKKVSLLTAASLTDFIQSAKYQEASDVITALDVNRMFLSNLTAIRRPAYQCLSQGLLWKANKSVDTLLACYSARYNVYANNGMAGILAKKQAPANGGAFEAAIMEGSKRDEILKDINERNGLTGRKNLWGISGVPVEFVKTIASISELMPFEETLESSVKIAAAFQIPSIIVPQKDNPTFNNVAAAEKSVWENSLLSLTNTVADDLTRMFRLDKIGYKIVADTSSVSALVANEKDNQELIKLELENIDKIKQINPDADVTELVNNIMLRYEQR